MIHSFYEIDAFVFSSIFNCLLVIIITSELLRVLKHHLDYPSPVVVIVQFDVNI